MEESGSLSDLELENAPKLTFDELKAMAMKDLKQLRNRNDLLKTLYYYCKDRNIFYQYVLNNLYKLFLAKKHSRIIKYLFWPLIIPFI